MTKKKIYLVSAAAVIALVLLVSWQLLKSKGGTELNGPTYEVKSGPLTISFVESGTIKARDQIILKNEVEGRTSITYVISEGTRVKKGDLLIELDVSTLEDQKIDREISVQNTEAAYISAKENLAVVENQAKSDVDMAKLTLDFANQDLEKYLQGEHPYELDKANADITLAEEELTRAKETLRWSKQLYGEKYISQTELQADEIAEKKKALDTELAKKSKDLLTDYTYKRNLAKLQSDVNQAEMAMERTQRKANADVIQAQAELKAKESEFERQKDKLAKVEDQIKKTKIYAPADGLVIYATSARSGGFRSSVEPLDVGREVQEREELIYLPTGNASNAEVMVHESNLKKIAAGMPAIVTVDALQGKTYYGTIESVAPLPDARSMWMNPDLKVYTTKIAIDGNDPSLRTGMSCQAEIIVQQHKDAVYVPLQTVIRVGAEPTVYVKTGNSSQPRQIKVGLDNNKVIHVLEGLKKGEIVLLNPPLKSAAVYSQAQSDPEKYGNDGLQEKINNGLKNVETNRIPAAEPNQQTNIKLPDAEKMKKQFENMTPEQREEMKKKFEQMTPEEREKALQKSGRNRQQGSRKRDPNEQKQ
ncbi:MAG: HlyD family efflux transporter periplasmic adaptor subunit [Sedimentisphaerales bacterium]